MRPDILAFYQMMMQNPQMQQGAINPALLSPAMMAHYQKQMSMNQMGGVSRPVTPEEESASPIQSGVRSGMNAARQSLAMNQEEKDRAIGMAMMQFGAHLGKPGYGQGFGGTLNAVNQSILPAVEAYQKEEARVAQLNAFAQQQEMEERNKQAQFLQKQQSQEAMERYRQAQLEGQERKLASKEKIEVQKLVQSERHHQQDLSVKQKKLENKFGVSEVTQGKEVPLKSLNKSFVNEWSKNVNKEIQAIPVNKVAIESIEQMRKIFEEYPDIGTSFLNHLEEEQKGGPSFWQTLLKSLPTTDQNKLSAVQKLRKLTADLQLDKIMGMPGQRATDIMKRAVQAASPTGRLTYDAFTEVSNLWEKRAHENIQRAKINENALKQGVYVGTDAYEKEPAAPSSAIKDIENLSDEELLRELNG